MQASTDLHESNVLTEHVETMSLQEAADRLGVHYMTAYRYVRQGRLDAVKRGAQWVVSADELDRFESGGDTDAESQSDRRVDWMQRLEERLLTGDANGAWDVVTGALNAGKTPEDVHMDMLVPALRSIGERWHVGEISVGDEHRASAVAMRIVGQLSPRFTRRGRKRGSVVVATPPGDLHSLPVAIMADLVRGAGFQVVDLGCDVPVDSLAQAIRGADRLRAVALGATAPDNEANVIAATAAARRAATETAGPRVPVILGGYAIADGADALRLGADAYGRDARDAVDIMLASPV